MERPPTPSGFDLSWSSASVTQAADLAAVFNAAASADDLPERLSASSMEHELVAYFDPLDDKTVVGRDPAGKAVCYATTYTREADAAEMRAYVNAYVMPFARERGLEEALLAWSISAATRVLRDMAAEKRFVCCWLYNKQDAAAARLAAEGFTPVRHWWEMARSLADSIDSVASGAYSVVPWIETHDEAARLVYNEAFADHWGSTPMSTGSWANQVVASPNFRRGMSFVALGNGEPVGYLACEEYPEDWEQAGQRESWVGALGVVRGWRRRGIATALLASSINAMRRAGSQAALIGVDSSSPTGAQHLYRALGFETKTAATTWQLEVANNEGPDEA